MKQVEDKKCKCNPPLIRGGICGSVSLTYDLCSEIAECKDCNGKENLCPSHEF